MCNGLFNIEYQNGIVYILHGLKYKRMDFNLNKDLRYVYVFVYLKRERVCIRMIVHGHLMRECMCMND